MIIINSIISPGLIYESLKKDTPQQTHPEGMRCVERLIRRAAFGFMPHQIHLMRLAIGFLLLVALRIYLKLTVDAAAVCIECEMHLLCIRMGRGDDGKDMR